MSDVSPTDKKTDGFLSNALKVIAYPFAAITGYWFAETKAQSGAYDNLMFHGVINDLRDPLKDSAAQIGQKAIDHVKRGEHFNIAHHTKAMHTSYNTEIATRMEQMELGTLFKKWAFLQKHQRHSVMVHGFTAAGIALGGLLTLAENKHLLNLLQGHEAEKQNEPNARLP